MKLLKITIFALLSAFAGAYSYAMDNQSDENRPPRAQYICSLGKPCTTSYYYDRSSLQQYLYLDGTQVGYIIYSDTCKHGRQHRYIDYLYLHQDMRKRGIGSECMRQFIQQSQRQGIRALELQSLDDLTSFYKRLGFSEVSNDLIFSNMMKLL